MQVGIPQSLVTPYGTADLNSALTNPSGYLVQYVGGNDFPTIRNPVDNRPMRPGGIVHPFFYGPVIITIMGLIVAQDPSERTDLDDFLMGCTDSILQANGHYNWTPPGQGGKSRTVRLYDGESISGSGATSGGSPNDLAAPKGFTIVLVSGTPSEAF